MNPLRWLGLGALASRVPYFYEEHVRSRHEYLAGLLKRFVHCVTRLHCRSIDATDEETVIVACGCGNVFYATPGYENSWVWRDLLAMGWIKITPGPGAQRVDS